MKINIKTWEAEAGFDEGEKAGGSCFGTPLCAIRILSKLF